MKQEEIQELMLDKLNAFNGMSKPKVENLNENTVHEEILSESDGFKSIKISSSASIYKQVIRGAILRRAKEEKIKQKDADKPWGKDWLKKTVKELAATILPLLLFFTSISQVTVNVSAAKTELGKDALKIALSYLYNLDSVFADKDLFISGKNSYFQIQPQFDIQTGTNDAFSSIQAKFTGQWLFFKQKEVAGFKSADLGRTFWLLPLSLGVESDNTFRRVNGLLELGLLPYWQTSTNKAPDWLKKVRLGLFLQAGYKFKGDTTGDVGGDIDESLEAPETGLLRLKTSLEANIIKPVQLGGFRFGLVGSGDLWYDLLNQVFYHRIISEARFFIIGDNFMSLFYERGSGAPNFNQGEQFGIGLTINF